MKINLVYPLYIALFLSIFASCTTNKNYPRMIAAEKEIQRDSISDNDNLSQVRIFKNDKISEIKFYGRDHSLRKQIKYLEVNDRSIPNQFFLFDKKGDTLNNRSLYYVIWYNEDTIAINEKYEFKIVLKGHIFDSAKLYLCNYNKDFVLDTARAKCTAFSMNKSYLYAVVSKDNNKKGWNYIRGRIDNYQNYTDKLGSKRNKQVSVYVLDSFYVR